MNVLIRVRRRVSCGSTDTPRCVRFLLDERAGFRTAADIFGGALTSSTLSISDGSAWACAIPENGNSFALFNSAAAAADSSARAPPVSGTLSGTSSLT